MSICAPKSFGSKFLKGGYGYWPLWWYGQKNKLRDMSGHGNDLTPYGAYFDGQGYYFDGVDDYLVDVYGRKILYPGTEGSWHSVYLTEDIVSTEGSIRGTGTKLYLDIKSTSPEITGKIVLRPEYCPNLEEFRCYRNNISHINVAGMTSLTYFNCSRNNLMSFDASTLTSLDILSFGINNISTLKLGTLVGLDELWCGTNNISSLDVGPLISLSVLMCDNNSMDQGMVDKVLCDMASHTVENGTLNISGNAKPSATGIACKDNLVSRGWSVTTD